MAVGVAWTTLSHSHRDSYAARPIRAEGLAPCDSVRALASLSAAFYKHSVALNAMVNELTVTHREGDRNDLRICRVCRCACGERARNRSTGAPGTTTCHELFCRSGRNGIALHITIIMDTITKN